MSVYTLFSPTCHAVFYTRTNRLHAMTVTIAVILALLVFQSLEKLANGLTNVTAFGLYSLAGLLLLPALFVTGSYPRWLAWLGAGEWSVAALATVLLVLALALATGPLLLSFALYAPWVWASGLWLLRRRPKNGRRRGAALIWACMRSA